MIKILVLLLLLPQLALSAIGNDQGNGGDVVVQEFKYLGQLTIKYLPIQSAVLTQTQLKILKDTIRSAHIESKYNTILNGTESRCN